MHRLLLCLLLVVTLPSALLAQQPDSIVVTDRLGYERKVVNPDTLPKHERKAYAGLAWGIQSASYSSDRSRPGSSSGLYGGPGLMFEAEIGARQYVGRSTFVAYYGLNVRRYLQRQLRVSSVMAHGAMFAGNESVRVGATLNIGPAFIASSDTRFDRINMPQTRLLVEPGIMLEIFGKSDSNFVIYGGLSLSFLTLSEDAGDTRGRTERVDHRWFNGMNRMRFGFWD
ncbi:MAG: hypothetical protein ACOCZ8_00995 [Bacteroidota bacterium]